MRKLKLTEYLILINTIIYIILAILSLNPLIISTTFLIWTAQYNYFIYFYFLYYEFFTAIFIHFNLAHLFGNLLFLLIFGYRFEDFFSNREYIIVYLSSGISGNIFSLFLGIFSLSGGSSGAILGIFSATLYAISVREKRSFKSLLFIGIIFMIILGAQYGVNPISHWIGFIVGLFLGRYFIKKSKYS
ncbi:MAG: rhomboid family intramembrane serine protease [Candidatus Helarchaeota archaeon]